MSNRENLREHLNEREFVYVTHEISDKCTKKKMCIREAFVVNRYVYKIVLRCKCAMLLIVLLCLYQN